MITVLVISDQSLQRLALTTLMARDPDLAVIGEATGTDQAAAMSAELCPDVVVLDRNLSSEDSLQTISRLAHPARAPFRSGSSRLVDRPRRVLVVNLASADTYAVAALRAGARGLVLDSARAADLIAAVRTVAAGGAVIPAEQTRSLLETVRRHQDPVPPAPARDLDQLTARERQVLAAIAAGWSNAEIAAWLTIAHATVKAHVSSVLRKIGARARVEAVSFAYDTGLVHAPSTSLPARYL
ncbi:LuxR C-terminal-related transcriptional regulator [Streptomyces hydrogenans]|uniref:LuxR C-terminal-related transcriptional regulator n=1 Tax=Streptomyces hydrogenans TaxID=1873719 RepID=UPI00381D75EA